MFLRSSEPLRPPTTPSDTTAGLGLATGRTPGAITEGAASGLGLGLGAAAGLTAGAWVGGGGAIVGGGGGLDEQADAVARASAARMGAQAALGRPSGTRVTLQPSVGHARPERRGKQRRG